MSFLFTLLSDSNLLTSFRFNQEIGNVIIKQWDKHLTSTNLININLLIFWFTFSFTSYICLDLISTKIIMKIWINLISLMVIGRLLFFPFSILFRVDDYDDDSSVHYFLYLRFEMDKVTWKLFKTKSNLVVFIIKYSVHIYDLVSGPMKISL